MFDREELNAKLLNWIVESLYAIFKKFPRNHMHNSVLISWGKDMIELKIGKCITCTIQSMYIHVLYIR